VPGVDDIIPQIVVLGNTEQRDARVISRPLPRITGSARRLYPGPTAQVPMLSYEGTGWQTQRS
jgi:hypothetical protein